MRYDRIYGDSNGESHFGEVELELGEVEYAPPAPPLHVSEPVEAERALLFRAPSDWVGDFHPSPRRQLYVCLKGELEITASSGETRRFAPGSVLLVEDTEGKGHISKVVGESYTEGLFVHLD